MLIVKTSDMTTQVKVAWFWFGCEREGAQPERSFSADRNREKLKGAWPSVKMHVCIRLICRYSTFQRTCLFRYNPANLHCQRDSYP